MKSAIKQLWQFSVQSWNREFEEMARSKSDSSALWHQKRCHSQPKIYASNICQAQTAVHQLRLNWLISTAFFQAFIDRITSPTWWQREEDAGRFLLSCCQKWEGITILENPQTSQTCFKTVQICWNSSSIWGICLLI